MVECPGGVDVSGVNALSVADFLSPRLRHACPRHEEGSLFARAVRFGGSSAEAEMAEQGGAIGEHLECW